MVESTGMTKRYKKTDTEDKIKNSLRKKSVEQVSFLKINLLIDKH